MLGQASTTLCPILLELNKLMSEVGHLKLMQVEINPRRFH